MKPIILKFHWPELIIATILGTFFGYFLLALVTEIRVDRLRTHIVKQAISDGIGAGVSEYEKRHLQNEPLLAKKRQVRDEALREYVKRLDKMLEMK